MYCESLFTFLGKDLIELEMENNKLVMKSLLSVTDLDYDKMEVITFNNKVFTFYQYKTDDGVSKYSLETLDLELRNISFIFKDLSVNDRIGHSNNELFLMNARLKVFSVNHYNLVEKVTIINASFRESDN